MQKNFVFAKQQTQMKKILNLVHFYIRTLNGIVF
jgi:hypothetical protein